MKEVALTDVPETMLWTLRNRAVEAKREDRILEDPKCIEIYESIHYDYERSFGKAEPSHAVRSWIFDNALRDFVKENPRGVIVNLGEGLETQRFRIPTDSSITWLSVDLPDAIQAREKFIQADSEHRHIAKSAFDQSWFDEVPPNRPVFVTAQGLFMYFEEVQVGELIRAMATRWPGMWLMFDHIPPWLSRRSTSEKGAYVTPHYRAPRAPWGIRPSEVRDFVTHWAGRVEGYENPFRDPKGLHYAPRGFKRHFFSFLLTLPKIADIAPGVCKIQLNPEA